MKDAPSRGRGSRKRYSAVGAIEYSEAAHPDQDHRRRAFARALAKDAFRRHFHPDAWDGFIDRPPAHISQVNQHDLVRFAAAAEGIRRKLVEPST